MKGAKDALKTVASAAKNFNTKDSQFLNSVKNVLKTVASAVKNFNAKNATFTNGVMNNINGAKKFVQGMAGSTIKNLPKSWKRN